MLPQLLAPALARRGIHYGWVVVAVTFVTALVSAGAAGAPGVFILPLQKEFGWTTAAISAALLIRLALFGLMAPFAAALLNRFGPSDVGQRAVGDDGALPLPPPPPPSGAITAAAFNALKDGSKTPVFWILFGTFFICGASTFGLIQTHLIPMCADYGLPAASAAGLLAAMGVFDFIGTIASGWLSDRYDNRWLLFWYYGLRGLSLMFLPFTNFDFYGLSLFAVFYGLDWIATVPPTVKLTAQKFGPERANLVFGWIFAGHQIGAAFAAFAAGLSRTLLATYLPAFFAAGALCLVAALIVLAIARQPKPVVA